MTENGVRELIIIGGGPAGYTAALYAARANLEPLVFEGFQWGGQLMITSDVENYPGYAEGVLGPEMMKDFRRQAARFGAEFVSDDVTRVDFSERPFHVYVGDEEHRAEAVIVATGANARQLGLQSEQNLQGRGVSYCAVCDAAFFREKEIVVVGGGDSAMEEAIFLTKFADKVTIVHRRDEFRASQIMEDRARANEKIEWITSAVVEEAIGENAVQAARSVTADRVADERRRLRAVAADHLCRRRDAVERGSRLRRQVPLPVGRRRPRGDLDDGVQPLGPRVLPPLVGQLEDVEPGLRLEDRRGAEAADRVEVLVRVEAPEPHPPPPRPGRIHVGEVVGPAAAFVRVVARCRMDPEEDVRRPPVGQALDRRLEDVEAEREQLGQPAHP